MVFLSLLSAFGTAAMSAALAVGTHGGSAPPAPDGVPEPLASSCRAEAEVAYAAELKLTHSRVDAAMTVQSAYQLAAVMDPRYIEYQRKGQIEMGADQSYSGAPRSRLRACLYGVRLQMLGDSVPQFSP